jgi:hypothetical protein
MSRLDPQGHCRGAEPCGGSKFHLQKFGPVIYSTTANELSAYVKLLQNISVFHDRSPAPGRPAQDIDLGKEKCRTGAVSLCQFKVQRSMTTARSRFSESRRALLLSNILKTHGAASRAPRHADSRLGGVDIKVV